MEKKLKKELAEATRASVEKEMAKPRTAKSAREGEANLIAEQIASVRREKAKLQLHPLALLRRAR
jgi:hypothetical protein